MKYLCTNKENSPMDSFFNDTLNKLEIAINGLEIEIENPLRRIEAVIPVVMQSLSE